MSNAIAAIILEDKPFVAEFTKKSRQAMAKNYSVAAKTLNEAGIDFVRDGYELSCYSKSDPTLSC